MRTISKTLCALSLVASLVSCGAPAYAEDNCGNATEIVDALGKLDQIQIGGGIVNDQAIVVIFATPTGSAWTAISMGVDGSACLLANGTEWFGGLPELPVPGERGA